MRLGGREYLGVLDTGATISIVAKKILPCWDLKNILHTAAIRMGDGHVVHGYRSPRKLHPVLRAKRAEKDRFATGQKNYFFGCLMNVI